MIVKDGIKQVVAIYEPLRSDSIRSILAIYKGAQLFWEAVRSCFGRGVWVNNRQWSDTDAWRNNV